MGILNKSNSEDEIEEEFIADDEIILDPFLTSILNEEREIIVGDTIYKYTEVGLYFSHKDNSEKLRTYVSELNYEEELKKISEIENNTDNPINLKTLVTSDINKFISIPSKSVLNPSENNEIISDKAIKSAKTAATTESVKNYFPISVVTQESFWQRIFGEAEGTAYDFGNNRRVLVKFWNQNYFIYSSIGTSARFQKRVKFLGISGWQKSYTEQIEIGVNYAEFEYNFNVPIFNQAQYNYNTIFFSSGNDHFTIDGRKVEKVPTGKASFIFDKDNPDADITISIFNNYLGGLSPAQANKAIDALLKQFAKNLSPWYNSSLKSKIEENDIKINVVHATPFTNKVKFITSNVRWRSNNDNAKTKYFDFNFKFTWKSTYSGAGDYLSGLSGATKYTGLKIDLYGAAFHNGRWGGIRMIKL